MKKFWTKEEDLRLIELSKDASLNYDKMGKILGRSLQGVANRLRKLGFKNTINKATYKLNHNFFSEYSIKNCYWAGFSAADGYIHQKSRTLNITLARYDKNILQKFKNDIEYTGPICDNIANQITEISSLKITSGQFLQDLHKNFNLFQKKTFRMEPPLLPNLLFSLSFFCGLMDGDGTIVVKKHFNERLQKNYDSIGIRITSASEKLLIWCKNLLDSLPLHDLAIHKYDIKIRKINNKNVFCLDLNGMKAALLIDYINSCPNLPPLMERKWKKDHVLEKIENVYKAKYFNNFAIFSEKMNDLIEI